MALVTGVLVVAAVNYEGSPIHDVQLNDGGVWVTNSELQMMARLNSQVHELEMGILTSSTSTAVFQEAASVQVYDDGGGNPERSVAVTNVVAGTSAPVPLPATYEAAGGRDTVAILDDATGNGWVKRSDQVNSFNDTVIPDLKVSTNSGVTVTKAGTALFADRSKGTVTAWKLDQTGRAVKGDTFDFDTEFTDDAVISAVGERPVVLQAGKLLRPGRDALEVSGDQPALQQPGPESDQVYVATEQGLWRTGAAGGDLERASDLEVNGTPAAPAVVAGCVHAAWNDPGTRNYLELCGNSEPVPGTIAPLTTASRLMFRSNRDVVVLNDASNGYTWMVQEDGLTLVRDWESVYPDAKDPQIAEQVEELQEQKRNRPPEAKKDEFGARAGKTVVLPVTLNDVDPDGDILTITRPPAAKDGTTFSVVGDGTQIQAKMSPNAQGSVTFEYEITDGRLGNPPAKATVDLRIFDSSIDEAPQRIEENQKNELRVADGHEASINVLPVWIDPEGDSMMLVDARTEDGGDVDFRPDGTVDFADDGTGPGRETIEFTVRGGEAERDGTVDVTVQDAGTAAPIAVADHASGIVGSSILLEPLTNDIDPLGGQMTLPKARVIAGGAAEVNRDSARGTATFRAQRHGTYYLEYQAASANGRLSEPTLVRVDVQARTGNNQPPTATRDIAAVRAGASALVDVLANDVDPDGDVMVVQGVEVPAQWADKIKASLINKRFVRVEAVKPFAGEQPTFDYLLSDGRSDQVRGAVTVSLAPALQNRRPTAFEDVVTARAGTIIDVPVLDNDADPDGDKLSVFQADLFDLGATKVISDHKIPVVATGSTIRVLVPESGVSQLQIGYGVRDPDQARADSRLVLNIKPDDPADNQAPQPRPIEDRTVSGQKIRIPLTSFGIDPDGDPVVFSAVAEPPKFGRIVRTGADWFEYEPYEGAGNTGTDEFKIRLSDPYGASGTADVRVGVAPRSMENQAPAALDDSLLVKPGLTIQYPVLQNDSDPDGDPLLLVDDGFHVPDGVDAELDKTLVEMRVPQLGGQSEISQTVQYTVTDGLGTSSSALFTVVTRADAPDYAPTAQDDVVPASDLRGKRSGDTVDVAVLANDGDLDGSKNDLDLAVTAAEVAEVAGRKVRVTLAKDSQVVPYRITDATNQVSFGFIYVAGTDNMPPILDTEAVPVKVTAGEPETIKLADVVVVRPGHTPKIAVRDRIAATGGEVTPDGSTAVRFKAPRDYHGPASVTLEVLDGENVNDPKSLQSQITIPITVLPAENVAPQVRSASVVVYAGHEARTLDLTRLATDVNGDALDFTVDGAKNGVRAEIEDDVLRISAAKDASSDELDLAVSVSDGRAKAVTGRVRVVVVGDDAMLEPPMVLRELRIPDGVKAEPISVDLREAIVYDPFPAKSKKVLSTEVDGPADKPAVSGSTLTVKPDDDGEIVISYRLDDGSGNPARAVEGRVTLVVAAVPDAPGKPTAVESGPDEIQLKWREPDSNGSPVVNYMVRDKGGETVAECQVTQCSLTNLDPGETYQFTVEAENAVGWSEPSPLSDPVTPDKVPDQMVAPVVEDSFGDRDQQLHLRWELPANSGSAIEKYELVASPGPIVQTVDNPAQTSFVWDGLANGTEYTFTIRAMNKEGWSLASAPSAPAMPFTKPSVMPAPGLSARAPDGDGKGYVTVQWSTISQPENGYDAVLQYEVNLTQDGNDLTTVLVTDPSITSREFEVENGHSYAARVRAINRAGTPEFSGPSSAKVAYDKASAVTNITKVDDCPGSECQANTSAYVGRVRFNTPADNGGGPVTKYDYRTTDGQTGRISGLSSAPGAQVEARIPFRSANQNQAVELTPVADVPGVGEVAGSAASGGDFDPYAKPTPPGGYATRLYMAVRFNWNAGGGNGRSVDQTQIQGSAGGTFGPGGQTDVGTNQGGEQRCIQMRSHTVAGWSDWSSPALCGNATDRLVTVRRGAAHNGGNRVDVYVEGFAPNTTQYADIALDGDSNWCGGAANCQDPRAFNVGGDGRGSLTNYYWNATCGTVNVWVDGVHGSLSWC